MKTKLHYLIIALLFGFGMIAQTTVSITGTGTGGWTQPGAVALTSTDGENFTGTNIEIVGNGEIKFSENANWGTSYGVATQPGFPSGVGTLTAASNIVATLGFWNVTYNTTSKAYSFTAGVNPYAVIKITGAGLVTDMQLQTANGDLYFKKSATFPGGNSKFIQDGTVNQWGGAFPDGPAVSAALIPIPAGTFNVYFTKSTGEYLFESTVISMMGNFVGSGWGTDVDLQTTDNVNFTLSGWVGTPQSPDIVLHMKIRDNHDWSYQFGVPLANVSEISGTLINKLNGGDPKDMTLPAGTYDVAFNRSTLVYSFTSLLASKSFIANNFKVFPNPTNSNWNFISNTNKKINTVQVSDILGKVVLTRMTSSNDVNIDASSLLRGVYFAKIASDDTVQTIKVVKN